MQCKCVGCSAHRFDCRSVSDTVAISNRIESIYVYTKYRNIISTPWRLRIVRLFYVYHCCYCCIFTFRFNLVNTTDRMRERKRTLIKCEKEKIQLKTFYIRKSTVRTHLLFNIGMVIFFFFLRLILCKQSQLYRSHSKQLCYCMAWWVFSWLNFKDSTRRFASFKCTGDRRPSHPNTHRDTQGRPLWQLMVKLKCLCHEFVIDCVHRFGRIENLKAFGCNSMYSIHFQVQFKCLFVGHCFVRIWIQIDYNFETFVFHTKRKLHRSNQV